MTITPDMVDETDDDTTAAEYVLGTLDLVARMTAQNRIKNDPAFAAMVEAWQNRLQDLNEDYAEVPAPNLMPQIEARLFGKAAARRKSWFSGFWLVAGSMALAVLVAAFILISPPAPSPSAPTMVATLSAEASPLRYEATFVGEDLVLTRVAGIEAEAGKDYELWIIEGDKAPVSLGLIAAASYTIAVPAAKPGFVLAITLEPKGGAPEGKPTGPIVAAGALQSI